MKVVVKLAHPETDKERLFQIEALVEDMRNPGEAHVHLDGKEYVMEIYFDSIPRISSIARSY
jgi:hypothetical protein